MFSLYPVPCFLAHVLRKHAETQEKDGACARRSVPKRTYVAENLPIPHPNHNCRNRAPEHSCEQNVGMSRRNDKRHDPAPLSLYNQTANTPRYISDHKNHVRGIQNPKSHSQMGSRAWTTQCLRKKGGGVRCKEKKGGTLGTLGHDSSDMDNLPLFFGFDGCIPLYGSSIYKNHTNTKH